MMRRRNMGDGCLTISPLSSVRPSFQSSCGFPATLFETSFRPCSQSKRGNWMIHSTPIFMASVFPFSCWWKPLSTSRYWRGLPSRSKRFSNDPSILDPYSTTKHRSCATEAGTAVELLFQKRERRQFWGCWRHMCDARKANFRSVRAVSESGFVPLFLGRTNDFVPRIRTQDT